MDKISKRDWLIYNTSIFNAICIFREELKQRKLVRMDSILDLPQPTALSWNVKLDVIQHTDMARFQMDR